jgi:hypothetical protein
MGYVKCLKVSDERQDGEDLVWGRKDGEYSFWG